jgi:chromosome segregation ATPase
MKTLLIALFVSLTQAPRASPTSLPADIADTIKKAVTQVAVFGEQGRLCETRRSNDLSQIRDLDGRVTEAKNKVVSLQKAEMDANARAIAARNQRDQAAIGEAQRAVTAAQTELRNVQALVQAMATNRQSLQDDLTSNEKCVASTQTALSNLIGPPPAAKPKS